MTGTGRIRAVVVTMVLLPVLGGCGNGSGGEDQIRAQAVDVLIESAASQDVTILESEAECVVDGLTERGIDLETIVATDADPSLMPDDVFDLIFGGCADLERLAEEQGVEIPEQ